MDLQAINSGPTPAQKNWLNPIVGVITSDTVVTDILTANTVDFKTIEAKSLTLVEQASVPNPAVGSQTLFVDSATGLLTSQDENGDSTPYLPTTGGTMTGILNMGGQVISGIASLLSVATNIIWGTGATATGTHNVSIGNATSTAGSSVAIGRSAVSNNGNGVSVGYNAVGGGFNQTLVGFNCSANDQQYACVFGQNARSTAFAAHTISSGDNLCTNSTANSVLFGDNTMVNIRSDSSLCNLGTSSQPFKVCWLKDAAPASSCKYSQYSNVTVTNTVTETSLATGTHVGTLVYSGTGISGTVYRFKLGASWTGTVGDSAIIRLKTNGAPLVAITMGPENSTTTGTIIEGTVIIGAGGSSQCQLKYTIGDLVSDITNATSAYNNNIVNTFDVSVQWSAADVGNVLTCTYLTVESLYAQ